MYTTIITRKGSPAFSRSTRASCIERIACTPRAPFFFLFILLIGMPVERRTGSFTSEALISRSSSLTQFDSQFRAESKRLDAVRYNQCGHGRWATSVGQRRWTGQASQMGTRKSQSRSKYQTWAQSCTSSKCARSVMFACL